MALLPFRATTDDIVTFDAVMKIQEALKGLRCWQWGPKSLK
jgi:hypothetical protein